jgi:gliding motility-associated-like protein
MKNSILVLMLAFSMLESSAQKFQNRSNQLLPDSVIYDAVQWADIDNDSLLDVVATGKTNSQQTIISIYKNNITSGLSHQVSLSGLANSAYTIVDLDSDNQLDVAVSGTENGSPHTIVFYNSGDFIFENELLLNTSGSLIKFADVNQDGKPELILSGSDGGGPFFKIYKGSLNQWHLVHDSIAVAATSVEVFDFDLDGDNDIFISGKNPEGKPASAIYYDAGNFFFKNKPVTPGIDGSSSVSDLNHDGRPDILLAGVDATSTSRSLVLLNKENQFSVRDTIPALQNNIIFTGDLNSDGECDISFFGLTVASQPINLIQHADKSYDTLIFQNLMTQTFGDFDRDGDLDIIQLLGSNGAQSIQIAENLTPLKNLPPSKPLNPVAATIFDRLFIYWSGSGDDHTPVQSLTYDVTVQAQADNVISGEFDLVKGKRLLVAHGNAGTKNYVLLRDSNSSDFNFSIQSVDNAYHADRPGICVGKKEDCTQLQFKDLVACRNEQINIPASSESGIWFSFKRGELGMHNNLNFTVTDADTVFVVHQSDGTACGSIEVFTIGVTGTRTSTSDSIKYVCEGQQINFDAEPGWEQILWSSTKKGILSHERSIVYTATESDTVKLRLSDGAGCIIERNTELTISKPVLLLENDAYQIIKGEGVQLSAQGGETYLWAPATGLDNNAINDPMARPLVTTEYVITISDSIGCEAKGKVLVIVEETAFIPNLFTPNDDGKNDELKAYGLDTVTDFSFLIYNREGSLMYSTNNISELSNFGWNGTVRGIKQPSGVYYWKVKGENNVGKSILLNGKSTGSIVLIR